MKIYKPNTKNVGDGIDMMMYVGGEIGLGRTTVCHFDPQYRANMDYLKYGNEGARQKERAELPQMSSQTVRAFIEWQYALLRPSGYMFFWMDSFTLLSGHAAELTKDTGFQAVDLITWDKEMMANGSRSRRCVEHMAVYQKPPILAKVTWKDHGIRDIVTDGGAVHEKTQGRLKGVHPHRKPLEFLKRLFAATTEPGDYIVDPCAGSYVTLEAAVPGSIVWATDLDGRYA